MSIEDENRAKRALAHYLIEWGVSNAPKLAHKFIDELVDQGWQMAPDRESRPRPPRAGEACHECNRHLDRCICEAGAVDRPPVRTAPTEAWRAARQELAAAGTHTPHTHPTENP